MNAPTNLLAFLRYYYLTVVHWTYVIAHMYELFTYMRNLIKKRTTIKDCGH